MNLRKTMARLKKLLRARDVDLIEQGVELVAALDDEAVWGTLLEGVRYDEDARGLVPNRIFSGTGPHQPYLDLALLMLVCRAPDDTLRNAITSLAFDARGIRVPLDGFDELIALHTLELSDGQFEQVGTLGWCPALLKLDISGWRTTIDTLEGLGDSETLTELELAVQEVTTLRGLEGAPLKRVRLSCRALRDIRSLSRTPVEELTVEPYGGAALPTMPALRELEIRTSGPLTSGPQPNLERLVASDVSSLPPGENLPSLRHLRLNRPQLADLSRLAACASLNELILFHGQVSDLAGIAELPLEHVALEAQRALERLDGLPGAKLWAARWNGASPTDVLDLSGCVNLTSLRGLGRLEGLVGLDLSGCLSLTTLDGLEQCTELRTLDLRKCSKLADVTALGRVPELRMVAIRGTGLHPDSLPESVRWTASLAKRPDLRAGRNRRRPKASAKKRRSRIPVPEAQREQWLQLMPMLAATDASAVDALVDHAASMGGPQVFDALLKPVKANKHGALTVRGRLTALDDDRLKRYCVQRLVGAAPAQSVEAKRISGTVTSWRVQGSKGSYWYYSRRNSGPVSLLGLEAFDHVEELTIYAASSLAGLDALGGMKRLKQLHITGGASLDGLGEVPGLARLRIEHSDLESLAPLSGLTGLTQLEIKDTPLTDLSGLEGLPISHLELPHLSNVADPSPLSRLAALKRAEMGAVRPVAIPSGKLESLRLVTHAWPHAHCLEGCVTPLLDIDIAGLSTLAGLDRMPQLSTLRLRGWRSNQVWTGLPTSLERLELGPGKDLRLADLPPVTVKTLVVHDVEDVDLSGVEDFAGLGVVELRGAGADLAPLAKATRLVKLTLVPRYSDELDLTPLVDHPSLSTIELRGYYRRNVVVPAELQSITSSSW